MLNPTQRGVHLGEVPTRLSEHGLRLRPLQRDGRPLWVVLVVGRDIALRRGQRVQLGERGTDRVLDLGPVDQKSGTRIRHLVVTRHLIGGFLIVAIARAAIG